MIQFTKQLLSVLVILLSLNLSYSQDSQKTRILFIFDASNSMNGKWESGKKIDIARNLLIQLVEVNTVLLWVILKVKVLLCKR